jgi:creatinine amidohydrolase
MNKPRPYILAETNWKAVKETDYTLAVLPWGATEAHNFHMPYGTDNFQAEHIAALAADEAWKKGAKLIVLPYIPFGVNTGQLDIKLCINMMPSTQLAILKDVCDVLSKQGINKLVIFNGHGANNFVPHIRELAGLFPELFICSLNWYQSASKIGIFQNPGDHADEMETSVMMNIAPDLLLPISEAGDGATKNYMLNGFREGWAWAQRPWSKITRDTGSGDPKAATVEKGKIFISATTSHIAAFFHQLATTPVSDLIG